MTDNSKQLQTGVGAFPHILSLFAANFKGVTKKMTMSAVVYISYCVGNIIGPQTFLPPEASRLVSKFSPRCQPFEHLAMLKLGLQGLSYGVQWHHVMLRTHDSLLRSVSMLPNGSKQTDIP
jgi:hypothetical protein